jgi:hypothetical protein
MIGGISGYWCLQLIGGTTAKTTLGDVCLTVTSGPLIGILRCFASDSEMVKAVRWRSYRSLGVIWRGEVQK